MADDDERLVANLRAAWPAPPPSAGFDAALEARLARRPTRVVWPWLLGAALATAAVLAVGLARRPLELTPPTLPVVAAVDTDELYAALELEADEDEWLPDDYVGLAEVLDL